MSFRSSAQAEDFDLLKMRPPGTPSQHKCIVKPLLLQFETSLPLRVSGMPHATRPRRHIVPKLRRAQSLLYIFLLVMSPPGGIQKLASIRNLPRPGVPTGKLRRAVRSKEDGCKPACQGHSKKYCLPPKLRLRLTNRISCSSPSA